MLNEQMHKLGNEPNAIRALFAYGMERRAQIGAENVFDFSLGNPSIPSPAAIRDSIIELMEQPPMTVHSYTAATGAQQVREAVARNIKERFGHDASPEQIYMVAGAAPAITTTLKAITHPGDEVIIISPYFAEYDVWIANAGCVPVPVPAHVPDFQLDIGAIARAINERTAAIIINSPNNPTGAVYTKQNLQDLAQMLTRIDDGLGHEIYLVCDEPYRELAYGVEVPYVPSIYAWTIVCYSWSKSFSLPGERIGYVYVNDQMPNARDVACAVGGAGRAMGYVNAPALFQYVVAKCIDEPVPVTAYEVNRRLLMNGLKRIGYEFVNPDGAFYLWVKALEDDAVAFSERAKAHEILVVPSDCFGVPGWVRIGYCVSRDTIVGSMPAFKDLYQEYQGQ